MHFASRASWGKITFSPGLSYCTSLDIAIRTVSSHKMSVHTFSANLWRLKSMILPGFLQNLDSIRLAQTGASGRE